MAMVDMGLDLRATATTVKEMVTMDSVAMDLWEATTTHLLMVDGLIGLSPLLTTTTLNSALAVTSTIGPEVVKKDAKTTTRTGSVVKRDTTLVNMAKVMADVVREVEVGLMTTDLSIQFHF